MFTKDKLDASKERSEQLASEVEAFLAKGGEVESVRDCTVGEAYARSRKPYTAKGKDGVVRIYRDHAKMF